jgi:hypothetical protein
MFLKTAIGTMLQLESPEHQIGMVQSFSWMAQCLLSLVTIGMSVVVADLLNPAQCILVLSAVPLLSLTIFYSIKPK